MTDSIEWFKEKVPYLPKKNWVYNAICFFVGKRKEKLSYQEIYLIIKTLMNKKLGDEKSKKFAMEQIKKLHEYFENNDENSLKNDE